MDLVLRAIILYFFIFLVARVIGRRELSSLAPFDLVLLIVIGDAIQQGLTQDDYSVTGAILVVATLAVLQVGTSFVSFRWPRARSVLEGNPVVLMEDGSFIEANMKRERMTPEEVAEEARLQQIDSIDKVKWAILEPSGKISFIT
jgi:uncharacterized membrane protein YcaP (DUF421 family)